MLVGDNLLCHSSGVAVRQHPTLNHDGRFAAGRPAFVILHYTATATAGEAVRLFCRSEPPRTSAHLVIDHDGTVTQMLPLDTIGWHAGVSNWQGLERLNLCSVGIEIVNFGWLTGGPQGWTSWNGARVGDDRVVLTPEHPDYQAWERFDEAELAAALLAAGAICRAYGIAPGHVLGHNEIAPGRKHDPGPAFDIVGFRAALGASLKISGP